MYISCKERLCIYDANAHDVFPLISNTITNTKHRSHTIISTTMFFPLLPLLFLPTSAAPTNPPTTPLYICTDASFASIAPCTKLWIQVSKCRSSPHPFPPHHHPPYSRPPDPIPPAFSNKVSSAGPDEGTFCTLYSEANCEGEALPFTYPGIRSLGRYGFDDEVESVRCDFITGCKSHP